LQGETGAQGPAGPQGLQGPAGPQGPQGIPGTNLVSSFIYAYNSGSQSINNNGSMVFTSYGANTGGGDSWSTNGSAFTIPATGVYQINFSINGARSSHAFAMGVTDSSNTLVQSDGVDLGYFTFNATGGSSTTTLSGQVIANCFAGDVVSLKNLGGYTFSYGNGLPTNAPSATLSILQIH
jgi:hypothetical protein